MAWYDAQRYCMENYTDLVSIRNQKQNEEVMLNGKKSITPFWIGLLCDVWEWADGGLSGYRNWGGDNSQPFSCVELVKGKNNIMSFWIGLLCDVWEWADGGLSAYRNWGTGQPRSESDCVCIETSKWISVPCNSYINSALCYRSNLTGIRTHSHSTREHA
ncbi:L-selectin-like [Electrophorus electricus]|uniref:L-selectin-like n=1 Tax=Electrophorus electricus TaxID=8005 RepID=UPI0015D0BEBE|nr:L-selectin-like [Electrophorus electricus]